MNSICGISAVFSTVQYALWGHVSAAQQEGPHSAAEQNLGHLHAQVRLGLLELKVHDHKDGHNRGNLLHEALLNPVRPHLQRFRSTRPPPPP